MLAKVQVDPSGMEIGDVIVPQLDGEGPLWLQIRRALALAILSDKWPAGTKIPGELSLTDYYRTSRRSHRATA